MSVQRLRNEGSAILVEHCGLPPIPIRNILLMVFLLMFGGVFAALAVQGLVPKLSDDWYLRFDWWWRIILYFMIFVGPVVLIVGLVAWHLMPSFDYLKRAVWDARDQSFTVTRSSLFRLDRRTDVDLHGIRAIQAYIGEERSGPISLDLEFDSDSRNSVEMQLEIEKVDRRSEALDVLFSIARLCGLSHYAINENDADLMAVSVGGAGLATAVPIPAVKRVARYDLDMTAAADEAPAPQVAALNPEEYRSWKIELETWSPGQVLRFHRPSCSTSELLFKGVGPAIACGLVSFFLASDFEGMTKILIPITGTIIGLAGGAIYARFRQPEHEVIIEKKSNRLSWRTGMRYYHRHLGEVDHIVLRGEEHTVHRKNSSDYTEYRCRLFAALRDSKEILLTQNDQWERCSDSQRKSLEPLAAAVAGEIGVPWRWRNYQEPTIHSLLSSFGHIAILLGLIGVMSFFAWGVWQQGQFRAEWDAAAESLEELGATVTRAGINIGDVHIFGDGLMVEIDDREFTDDDLQEILKRLEPIPLYALDLSDTAITDEGLRQFVGRTELFLVDLSGTNISTEAVDILARTNLRSIDVRNTPIRLEHLRAFREFNPLLVMFINDDEISEEDLFAIDRIPYLDAILVNDERTSKEITNRLNGNLTLEDGSLTAVERQRASDAFSLKVAGEIRYSLD